VINEFSTFSVENPVESVQNLDTMGFFRFLPAVDNFRHSFLLIGKPCKQGTFLGAQKVCANCLTVCTLTNLSVWGIIK